MQKVPSVVRLLLSDELHALSPIKRKLDTIAHSAGLRSHRPCFIVVCLTVAPYRFAYIELDCFGFPS